jgi:hypothetical protein
MESRAIRMRAAGPRHFAGIWLPRASEYRGRRPDFEARNQ